MAGGAEDTHNVQHSVSIVSQCSSSQASCDLPIICQRPVRGVCCTRDNSHESLEYCDLSYERLEYIHLSCKCLGKRSIYHPSIQLFRQQLTKVFACPWKFSWAQLLNNHFLALIVAARNKYLCNFWYLHFCIFSPCTISCWHEHCHLQKYVELLTIDPHFPSSCFTGGPSSPFSWSKHRPG